MLENKAAIIPAPQKCDRERAIATKRAVSWRAEQPKRKDKRPAATWLAVFWVEEVAIIAQIVVSLAHDVHLQEESGWREGAASGASYGRGTQDVHAATPFGAPQTASPSGAPERVRQMSTGESSKYPTPPPLYPPPLAGVLALV